VIDKAALHRIRENPAQTGVQALNGALGERLSSGLIVNLPHISIKLAEMFKAEIVSPSGSRPQYGKRSQRAG